MGAGVVGAGTVGAGAVGAGAGRARPDRSIPIDRRELHPALQRDAQLILAVHAHGALDQADQALQPPLSSLLSLPCRQEERDASESRVDCLMAVCYVIS